MDTFLKRYFEKVVVKTMLLTMASCVVAGLGLFYFHTMAQEEMLSTEISNRSEAVGNSIVRLVEIALENGIPIDEFVDMPEYLNSNMQSSDELSYIAVTDIDGFLLYNSIHFENSIRGLFKRFALGTYENDEKISGFNISNKYYNIPLKINNDGKDTGFLHLGVSKKATTGRIDDIYYDIITILFVSIVIGFEFFIFIFRNTVTQAFTELMSTMRRVINDDYTRTSVKRTKDAVGELTQKLNQLITHTAKMYQGISRFAAPQHHQDQSREDQFLHIRETLIETTDGKSFPQDGTPTQDVLQPIVDNLRLPAFLLVLAETILVTILPTYASQFYDPLLGLSKQFISGSPVLVFMLFSGLAIPLSNKISYKIGFQKTLIIGLIFSTIGYLLACFTSSLLILLTTRAITAFGYGLAYASCQNYIAAYAPAKKRIQSYAIFAIAFGGAYICGSPIGGILVENVGYNFTFSVAAFSSIICLMIVKKYIVDFSNFTLQKRRVTKKTPRQLFLCKPLVAAVIFSGVPARMIFSSLICFIYPLYLRSLGNSQASVGRIVMIYGIVSFVASPFAARIIERIYSGPYTLMLSALCIASSLFLTFFTTNLLTTCFALGIYTLGSVLHTCSMMSVLERIAEIEYENHTKDTILSFYFIFERVGMITGPAIFSLALTFYDYQTTIVMMAAVVFISTFIYFILNFSIGSYYSQKNSIGAANEA